MWRPTRSWPVPTIARRRLAAVALSLGVIALELMLILWGFPSAPPPTRAGTDGANGTSAHLSAFNLQAIALTRPTKRAAKPPPQSMPKPKLPHPVPAAPAHSAIDPDLAAQEALDEASLAAFVPLSGQHGTAAPCSLAQDLAADLQENPLAQRALARIPSGSTVIAGALLLWDGRWVIADADPGSIVLREIVVREVAAAKPDCLAGLNVGPQFLFVSSGSKTMTIVIGSGQWRWGDLATSL